ncbi:LTA synthase family protein [Rhodanobacter sp. Si-c]|uniref:LTA synthase family protein n=1 Tax=Rhodanobacter lycopersici TaxID=3162487 RepID=A0ABV3QI95_9GAMM
MTPSAVPNLRRAAPRIALILAMTLIFVLLTGLLDGGKGVLPLRLLDQPRFPIANAWPGLLFAGLLLVMTRRLLLSFGLAYLLQGLIYGVSALKAANLGTPLLPADFRMVGQLRKGGFHLLAGYLPHSPWPYLALIAGVLILLAMWRLEPPLFARRTGGKRLAAGGVLLLLFGSLLGGWSGWAKIYNGRVLWLEPWSAASTRVHAGLLSELVMFHLQYGQQKPKPDRTIAEQLIGQSADALRQHLAMPNASVLPDIVVVQSESFFDPSIMKGYAHSDLTPNLHRLAQHGISGALHVPTFGGGTIRTEFEVLSGLSLRYFDNLQFPYLQIGRKPMSSLVQVLDEHGYATVAVHGNDPTFWNRNIAFKTLGFQRFVSQSAFPPDAPNDGKYMADSAMTDEIMRQLKDSGPPQFIFAISIEAHGPYDVVPKDTAARDAIAVPAGIEGKNKLELQTYLYHMQHADQELGRLAALLAKRQRPALLLFYGDHLPALTDSYRIDGFVNGGDMLAQAGTWLLVDPHATTGQPVHEDTAAWLLPGKLLAAAGIHDDPYFALTELLGPQLAALTRAPGAPQPDEDAATRQLDQSMGSVEQLRMNRKLQAVLAKVIGGTPAPTTVVHAAPAPATPGEGARLTH